MMAGHPDPDQFDATVRRSLEDVAGASRPAHDLTDRLVANARAGGPSVVSLAARRRASRWGLPLLAAASVAVLAIGGAVGASILADDKPAAPPTTSPWVTQTPSPPPPSLPSSVPPATSSPPASGSATATRSARDVPVPAHFRAADVYFVDGVHGWAVGDGKCPNSAATSCPALIATTNGGRDWHALSLPPGLISTFDVGSCGTNGNVNGPCVDQVQFADLNHGYLWSLHQFFWTTDGGRTWQGQTAPNTEWRGATQLAVVGDSAVRLAPAQECSAGCFGNLQVSRLGRGDWQTVRKAALYGSKLAVHGGDVYLFTGSPFYGSNAGILHSSDGGRTWSIFAGAPCGTSRTGDPLLIADPSAVTDDGALVVACSVGTSGVEFRTAAPGSAQFSSLRHVTGTSSTVDARALGGRSARQFSLLLGAPQPGGTVLTTDDGGRTWQRLGSVASGGQLRFSSPSDGYATAPDNASVFVTADGGLTWAIRSFD